MGEGKEGRVGKRLGEGRDGRREGGAGRSREEVHGGERKLRGVASEEQREKRNQGILIKGGEYVHTIEAETLIISSKKSIGEK